MRLLAPLATLAVGVAAPAARADTIYLTDGSLISDCTVTDETLATVGYRLDKDKSEVPSEKVLRVEFERKPELVREADAEVGEKNYSDAIAIFEDFLKGFAEKPSRKHPWAPAYAMYRVLEVNGIMGKADAMVAAADRVIASAPDSRYLPLAYLKKAEALAAQDKGGSALGVLKEFEGVIDGKGLAERWKHECRLDAVLHDAKLTGEGRIKALEKVSEDTAGTYPVVHNRAEVAIAETYLETKKIADAQKIFEAISADPQADDRTLAAAYTGLGECQFNQGAGSKDQKLLGEALKNFMRVAVVHKDELRYAPKAMYYAGRVYDLVEDEEGKARAQKLYARAYMGYRGSPWADEAKKYLR